MLNFAGCHYALLLTVHCSATRGELQRWFYFDVIAFWFISGDCVTRKMC